jgi:hypothetical protein
MADKAMAKARGPPAHTLPAPRVHCAFAPSPAQRPTSLKQLRVKVPSLKQPSAPKEPCAKATKIHNEQLASWSLF